MTIPGQALFPFSSLKGEKKGRKEMWYKSDSSEGFRGKGGGERKKKGGDGSSFFKENKRGTMINPLPLPKWEKRGGREIPFHLRRKDKEKQRKGVDLSLFPPLRNQGEGFHNPHSSFEGESELGGGKK